jgi:hypothetical protein
MKHPETCQYQTMKHPEQKTFPQVKPRKKVITTLKLQRSVTPNRADVASAGVLTFLRVLLDDSGSPVLVSQKRRVQRSLCKPLKESESNAMSSKKNTAELVRLLQEHMKDAGLGPEAIAKRLPEKSGRSFYNWLTGTAPWVSMRGPLEEALGWRRGSVTEVLDSPITRTFTLAEVRDWAELEDKPVERASELTTDELLVELTRRVGVLQAEVDSLRGAGPSRPMFDLAANGTAAGRNMEHLEGDE